MRQYDIHYDEMPVTLRSSMFLLVCIAIMVFYRKKKSCHLIILPVYSYIRLTKKCCRSTYTALRSTYSAFRSTYTALRSTYSALRSTYKCVNFGCKPLIVDFKHCLSYSCDFYILFKNKDMKGPIIYSVFC